MIKRLLYLSIAVLWTLGCLLVFPVLVLAAGGDQSGSSLAIATALVIAWGWIAPLTVYRWIPAKDARMKAITMVLSFLIGGVALLLGGAHPDLSGAAGLYAFGLLVYGEQQIVWNLLETAAPAAVK